jgi:hypothetical protein
MSLRQRIQRTRGAPSIFTVGHPNCTKTCRSGVERIVRLGLRLAVAQQLVLA